MKRARFVELGSGQDVEEAIDRDFLSIETAIDFFIRDSIGCSWKVIAVISATSFNFQYTLAQVQTWVEMQLELRFKLGIPVIILTSDFDPCEVNVAKRRYDVDPEQSQLIVTVGRGLCVPAFCNAGIKNIRLLSAEEF